MGALVIAISLVMPRRRQCGFYAYVARKLGVPESDVTPESYLADVNALRAKRQAGLVIR